MNFLIADTFADSLSKLTGEEQKQVKTSAFDMQMNPAGHEKTLKQHDTIVIKSDFSEEVICMAL